MFKTRLGIRQPLSFAAIGVVSTVGFITGGVGLGAATYLFLSAPPPTEKTQSGAYLLGIRAKW